MLLERLAIENYGVYGGRSEMDLRTDPERPIILVGGMNGAGKTTLFESIMVALYGRAYMGARTTRKQYLEFISRRIHRLRGGGRAGRAGVEVAFRFCHNGSEDQYLVGRSWDVEGASVTESLRVKKNGEEMSDIDDSLWQSFIEGLIPIGIARLFFFDGEKIVRVTEWQDGDNAEIKSSLDALLGMDLINRLDADLDLYAVRNSGGGGDGHTKRFEGMSGEKERIASEIEELEQERDRRAGELESVMSAIRSKEEGVSGLGGGYAQMRGDLLTRRAVLREKARHEARGIAESMSEDAPLYLVPDLLGGVGRQLRSDLDAMAARSSGEALKRYADSLKEELASHAAWPGGPPTEAQMGVINSKIDAAAGEPRTRAFFDVSPGDAERLLQKIEAVGNGPGGMLGMLDGHAETLELLGKAESDLAKIPRDDEIGPLVTEINGLHEEAGMLKGEVLGIEQRISSKRAHLTIVRSGLRRLVDEMQRGERAGAGVALAARVKEVLATYHASMREKKMRELESHLLETASAILHKRLISRVEVDRETLEIRVYGHDGGDAPIPGGLLSMGERQMVGTALLWAIARTCGRPLPFVIDTPLGRLDGAHLENLVDKFYPSVSHQLVLLSTNREIGPGEHERLAGSISREYRIEYDAEEAATQIHDGYFGGGAGAE